MSSALRTEGTGPQLRAERERVPVVSVSPPKRRRPSWVVAGVVLVGLAALLGAYVLTAVSETLSVVVAARDLQPGEEIDVGDLRVVELGRTSELRAIQSSQQDLILGLAPRGPVPAGTVLNTGLFVAPSDVLPDGRVVVGAALATGAVPTASLGPGDSVGLLVVAADAGAAPAAPESPPTAELVGTGSVWAVEGSFESATDEIWVSLLVDERLQLAVVQAAADGRLRLSLTGS